MLNETSLAAGVGVSVSNTQFASEARNLPRKIVIIGTYDPAKTSVVPEQTQLVLSPEDVGSRCGFGTMLHRLAVQAFLGSSGVETHILPQAEAGGAAAATGVIDFTGSANVVGGTAYLYIAGLLARFTVTAGMTAAQLATACATAINALRDLPVTAVASTNAVNLTAKSKGPWGNDISVTFNLGAGQALPAGVTAAVTAMSNGAGLPNIATALNALGTGDSANEDFFTDLIHGYGKDSATLDAISTYVGAGNEALGLYGKTVARPLRALCGDVAAGSSGLSALVTLAGNRKLDRANGVISVPDSPSHPAEIAAQAMGHMARINQDRVAQHYTGIALINIWPGGRADNWTSDYDNRDTAVKSGISPTRVQNGVVTLQNVVTFYRPDNVPVSSNGYRSMRNIAIIQNMLYNVGLNFSQEKWQGVSIVEDVARVSSMVDRLKVRDIDAVIDDLTALVKSFYAHGWVYTDSFTLDRLKQKGAVQIRQGGTGFNSILPVIFSGEGDIYDTLIAFDTSLAVLLNS